MSKVFVKRAVAILIFIAMILSFSACGANSEVNASSQSATNNGTETPTTPTAEEKGVDKVASLVKKMINETYADNFDYYVKSVTITGLNVKKAENPVDNVNVDFASSNKAIVDISYVAESVNKQTGEEKVVSNGISYTVNSEKALEVAQQGVDNLEIETVADAIVESTQEKIEQEQETGANENDSIAGTQISAKEELINLFHQKVVEEVLKDERFSYYLNNGYSLKSTERPPLEELIWFEVGKSATSQYYTICFDTSNGNFFMVQQDGVYGAGVVAKIVTIAQKENEEDVFLTRQINVTFALNESEYDYFHNLVNEYTNNYLDYAIGLVPETVEEMGFYQQGYQVANSSGLTDEIFNRLYSIVKNNSITDLASSPIWVLDKSSLTTNEQLALNALNVEGNPFVITTNPTNK